MIANIFPVWKNCLIHKILFLILETYIFYSLEIQDCFHMSYRNDIECRAQITYQHMQKCNSKKYAQCTYNDYVCTYLVHAQKTFVPQALRSSRVQTDLTIHPEKRVELPRGKSEQKKTVLYIYVSFCIKESSLQYKSKSIS